MRAGLGCMAILGCLVLGACVSGGAGGPGPDPAQGIEAPTPEFARLAGDFYGRLANRRFDSIATYQDPGLREYFETEESFADYYADLAQALSGANFEAHRPSSVEIQAIESPAPDRVIVQVRFVGANGLPLRWWTTELLRTDRWRQSAGGRWWVVPGKF